MNNPITLTAQAKEFSLVAPKSFNQKHTDGLYQAITAALKGQQMAVSGNVFPAAESPANKQAAQAPRKNKAQSDQRVSPAVKAKAPIKKESGFVFNNSVFVLATFAK